MTHVEMLIYGVAEEIMMVQLIRLLSLKRETRMDVYISRFMMWFTSLKLLLLRIFDNRKCISLLRLQGGVLIET